MSFWDGRRTLVTGGSGFIGSHLVERLLEQGAKVRVVGRSRKNLEKMVGLKSSDVEFLEGDLRDLDFTTNICEGMEAVFNLAARVAGAGWNSSHPGSMFTQNIELSLHLLDSAVRHGVERFLCVSSACVYSRDCTVPTKESEGFWDNPDLSNFGYGWAKRVLEVQAKSYSKEYPIKIGIVRPYNGYGPRDNFEWETSHVIPALIRKVIEGQDPINVWGDGSQTRSFLYVEDFVKGLMLGLEIYPEPDPVNIGTDEEVTIKELILLIAKLAGRSNRLEFDTSKPTGQPRRNGDFSKARALLNFEPSFTLEKGLRQTIDWYILTRS